jgi:hypothetical protein
MKFKSRLLWGLRVSALGVLAFTPTHGKAETINVSGDIALPPGAPSSLLDIGNRAVFVDNATSAEDLVRQYLSAGYNPDPSGIGNWLGTAGITSGDAIASHNGPNPDFKVSVGYLNGAYADDSLIGGTIPGQAGLPTDRFLLRPALYGDLNLDGKVDDLDLQIFSGLGMYNAATDKFGWLGGDLNYDGRVDDIDLQIFSGAGNYGAPAYQLSEAPADALAAVPLPSTAAAGMAMLAALGVIQYARRRRKASLL